MTIGNVLLMQECFPKHSQIGTARIKNKTKKFKLQLRN